jgi:hypothetical protein
MGFGGVQPSSLPRGRIILAKNAFTEGDASPSSLGAAVIRLPRLAVTIAGFRVSLVGGGIVTVLSHS